MSAVNSNKKKQMETQFMKKPSLLELKKDDAPYMLTLEHLYKQYHFTHSNESNEQVIHFLDTYLFDYLDSVVYPIEQEQLIHDMSTYQQLLETFFLLKNDTNTFQQCINYLKDIVEDRLEIITHWPTQFILSIFTLRKKGQDFYFVDIRNKQEYRIENIQSQKLNSISLRNMKVLALIVPINEIYISTPPIVCEPDQLIQKVFINSPDDKAPIDIIQWYSGTIQDCLLKDVAFDEMIELEKDARDDALPAFYSAKKKGTETSEEFARRIVAQDETLNEFVHKEQLIKFLIQVIEKFPQMFFDRSNAFSLTEALRDIFTDEEIDDEQFAAYSNFASLFWYGFLQENMSKDVKTIEKYKVSKDYWFDQFSSL
ncbi:hypothetical protein [Enterococcus sp. AZ109]|uniref:hypothetical protein n=1 Tax=Enterococcus sp. AZ109 TaxID=2774634 RepID=UPI003F27A80A